MEIQRQQERERVLRERLEERPDVMIDRVVDDFERLPKDEQPCFVIHEILLEGENKDRFMFALQAANPPKDPALGRCLGTQGINIVMKRVQNRIIQRGFVTTRILAAPQDISSGTLILTVIPGKVRNIKFSEQTSEHASKWNASPVRPGEILNLRDIEQTLENFKRLPTATANFQIAPAEGDKARPGESDIIIDWKQTRPIRFNVSVNDSGTKHTGKQQGNATVLLEHMLRSNDLFYFSYGQNLSGVQNRDTGKGTRSHVFHYGIPYKYWLFSVTSSKFNYHRTILGIGENYLYSGISQNNQARLTRLLYRDAVRKSSAWFSGWQRTSSNYIEDIEIELQRRRMAGWEFGLNHREFIKRAVLDATVSYRRGTGMLQSKRAPEEPFGEGTSRPEIVLANLFFNVPFSVLDKQLCYSLNFRGQLDRTPLVPQDRFAIGNRFTVRGFDGEMALMGDRGWLVRNDVGIVLRNTGQFLYVGMDHGKVDGQSTKHLTSKYLTGAFMGIRGGHRGLYWDVFAGMPISKPDGFETMRVTTGFNVGVVY